MTITVKRYIDQYALESGLNYMATTGAFSARGKTPDAAKRKLEEHFTTLRRSIVSEPSNYRCA